MSGNTIETMTERVSRRRELGLSWCCVCKQEKPQNEFCISRNRKPFGLASCCRLCENARKKPYCKKRWQALTPEQRLAWNRKYCIRRHGIDQSDYARISERQDGVCAICKKPESAKHGATKTVKLLTVDHDHITGKTRGLLCARCNVGIGMLGDDPEILIAAAKYIQASREQGEAL
jgi:hypothetical protein